MAMGRRLKELREARGLSQPQVAKDVKEIQQQALAALESRDSKTSEFAPQLADYYQVSLRWLLTGKGRQDDADWPFPMVDRARWDACSDTDRGYVQAVINQALDKCESIRPTPAETTGRTITGKGLRSLPSEEPPENHGSRADQPRQSRPSGHTP